MFEFFNEFKHKEVLIILYLILFILGFNLEITDLLYNDARVVEIIILLLFYGIGLIKKQLIFSKEDFFFLFFLTIGCFFWSNHSFIVVELLLAYLLYKSFEVLSYNNLITKIIVFLSFLVFLLLPISLWNYIDTGYYDAIWQPMPWNIRVYDSYFLIVSIFSVWLYITETKYKTIYLFFIFLAFLSILLDAGRSATLAYTAFVAIICIANSLIRWKLLGIYIVTWLTYVSLSYVAAFNLIGSNSLGLQVIRKTSSARNDLWLNAYECWVQNPIWGCGFYQLQSFTHLAAHPHNIFIQVLSETGFIGFGFLIIMILLMIKKINWKSKYSYFVLAALLAIFIDASLSGVYIYPVTQIFLLWLLVLIIKNPKLKNFKQLKYNKNISLIVQSYFGFIVYLIIVGIFSYLFINTTVFEYNEISTPPRFWSYGYKLL